MSYKDYCDSPIDYNDYRYSLSWNNYRVPAYRDHYQLVRNLIHDSAYRANPCNAHHERYKRACTRWFLFFLVILTVGFYPVFPDAAHGAILVAASTILVLLALFLIGKGLEIIIDFIGWLSGN
jgi:uncharacterized membrane protein